jgi:hypothetical protein
MVSYRSEMAIEACSIDHTQWSLPKREEGHEQEGDAEQRSDERHNTPRWLTMHIQSTR